MKTTSVGIRPRRRPPALRPAILPAAVAGWAALGLLLVWLGGAVAGAEEAPRVNVVLVMCDDMGFSDVGCYGGEIRTPHLDRLAAEGLRFTQFYNCAKCTTTRASLVTGLHPRFGKGGLLRENMVTIAEVLRAAGYQTSLSGKWHLGSSPPRRPIDRGFDEYYGLMDGCSNFFDPSMPDPPYKGGHVRTFGHNDRLITEFLENLYSRHGASEMWFVRLLLVLGVVALVGCGPRETSTSVEEASGQDQMKSALETVADTGEMDSGIMMVREQVEEMQSTDAAKADELLKDLDDIESLSDPAQVKAKAQQMIEKL